jgi:mannose-6-phosphate isomerase
MAELYPLFFKPVFKHYLWGGRNLEKFGRDLPSKGVVAESWEISGHPDGLTRVKNGIYAGKTLPELLSLLGEALVGTNNTWALHRGKFPLLIKLLDANRRLSVQVHPDDAYAIENEGNELGKTEMWVVLKADPNARIIYGLAANISPNIFKQAVKTGELVQYLNHIKLQKGDHICVPARTLHAILEGSVIVEIQQNSNTTYRVFDWNRVDDEGNPRDLHLQKALDVIDFTQVGENLAIPEMTVNNENYLCERLCSNAYFTTERYFMHPGGKYEGVCDGRSLEIWGVIEGKAEISGNDLSAVKFVLLPAKMGSFKVSVSDKATLLRTFVV